MLTFFQQTFLKKLSPLLFAVAVFCMVFVISIQDSYSSFIRHGAGRIRSCEANGSKPKGTPEGLEFFSVSTDNSLGIPMIDCGDDVDFVFSNLVCRAVAIQAYASVKISIASMNKICGTGSSRPRVFPSPSLDAIDIGKATIKGVQNASGGNYSCANAVANTMSFWSLMTTELAIIYTIALNTYNNTEICGAKWVKPNPKTYDISLPDKKQKVMDAVEKYIRDGETSKLSLGSGGDKAYREWYYGGEEVEDNPADGDICYDVTQAKSGGEYPRQKYYMRGTQAGNFNCKKYDLHDGDKDPLTNEPVSAERVRQLQKAYQCCKKRSSSYICLNYTALSSALGGGESDVDVGVDVGVGVDTTVVEGRVATENPIEGMKVFCKAGELCTMGGIGSLATKTGITFETKTLDNGSLICAQSYSLCPYNFTIGGGSEYCDYYQDGNWDEESMRWIMITPDDVKKGKCSSKSEIREDDCSYNNKANKCRNYCQYLTHCTTTSVANNEYSSNLGSPYFAEACINFTGDSQNKTSYDVGYILNSQKHFSAPIAQCVKETMENLFGNVAGHSSCGTENEYPDSDGVCPSGIYKKMDSHLDYKKGNQVKEESFFSLVQNNMKSAVKLVMTLSIMFYGMNILIGKADIREKKDILMYLIKIALVLYFATGDAWQSMFFKGVYGASSEFSQMVFKINAEESPLKRDGCQFGMISKSDGTQESSGRLYPAGKEYLALWDTLDCKMMRYLGYGPEVNVANFASLILAGYFSFNILGVSSTGVGIYFAIAVMFFGFFFLAATLRALHIFLGSAMAIIILVFVSPIIIPTVLFAKTSDIFKKWVTELIGYSLQPMILFAYIAFFINIMDKSMIGSATFHGQAPFKTISCDKVCYNGNGSVKPYGLDGKAPDCDESGDKMVNPMDDSFACLINLEDYGTIQALSMIGVTIPVLMNVFGENGKIKVLTIIKGALVMYVLYKLMNEISGMATQLVGGSALPGSAADPVAMMRKLKGGLEAIQKRAAGGSKKLGKKGLEASRSAKDAIQKSGNEGKKSGGGGDGDGGDSDDKGGDHSANSLDGDSSSSSEGGDSSSDSAAGDNSASGPSGDDSSKS